MKRSTGYWIAGCTSLVAIFLFFSFLGGVLLIGGDDDTSSYSDSRSNTRPPSTNSANSDSSDTSDEPAPAPAEKTWQTVFTISATADKQTESFRLDGGKQRLVYTSTPGSGSYSSCYVYAMNEGESLDEVGGIAEIDVNGAADDNTLLRKKRGDYYLDLSVHNTTCNVEVQEWK